MSVDDPETGPGATTGPSLPDAARSERWAAHLAMISEVGKMATSSLEMRRLLTDVVKAIHKGFAYYDVSVFLVDRESRECVLMAHAGEYGEALVEGYRQPIGVGMVGWVAEHGRKLLANDVAHEPRHILAFPEEAACRSELTVPVLLDRNVIGVINVENQQPDAFDERDVLALETIADRLAQAMTNARLYEQARVLADFHENVVNSIPSAVCVLDREGRVLSLNKSFAGMFELSEVSCKGAPIGSLLPPGLLAAVNLPVMLPRVFNEGGPWRFGSVREGVGQGRIFDVRFARAQLPDGPAALLVIDDVTQWRQAEASAENQARQLRMVMQCLPIGLGTVDLAGRFTFWAPGGEKVCGYTSEDVIGKHAGQFFGEERAFHEWLQQCALKGAMSSETMLRRKAGGEVPVELTLARMQDDRDSHVGFTLLILDVTERSLAESELLREKQKLTDVVNVIGAGIALIGRDHRIAWANKQLADWFSHGESLVGQPCYSVYCSRGGVCDQCIAERVFSGESYAEYVDAIPTADGVIRHFSHAASPVYGPDGEIVQVLKLTQDVTDQTRKLYEVSRLRQLGEVMQGVLDIDRLLHFILTCVTAGQALGFNRAMLFMVDEERRFLNGRLGVGPASAEEAHSIWHRIIQEGRSLQDLLAAYDRGPVIADEAMTEIATSLRLSLYGRDHVAAQCVLEKRAVLVEDAANDERVPEEFARRLGANSFVLVPLISRGEVIGMIESDNLYSGRPIEADDVEILAMLASQAGLAISTAEAYRRQVEQREQLEKAYRDLAKAQEQLLQNERLVTIGKMAMHVAHEIRNPLATIGGYGRLILKDPSTSKTGGDFARVIVEEVSRLEEILKGVLDFTRPQQPVLRPMDLSDVVARVVHLTAEQCRDRGVAVKQDLASGLPHVWLDRGQMSQVLLNLVQNALEAMPEGGEIEVSATASEQMVEMIVADTGPGIPDGHLASLFEPFFTTKRGGTGLGLAVSQKIITDHGGEIRVQTQEGEGSRFRIRLPLEKPADPVSSGDSPEDGGASEK